MTIETRKARTYHTVLVRDDTDKPWDVMFGDYDRETVEQEVRDSRDQGIPRHCLRIISTGPAQEDITARVAELNA